MRFIAMMVGPVFYAITMFLLHPVDYKIIVIGLVLVTAVFAWLDKVMP